MQRPQSAWESAAADANSLSGSDTAGRLDQTRRRLDGLTPLCGIGVTSRMDVMVKPTACKARRADSRPEPGPLISTSSVRTPCSAAFLPASSAATWAAYGVD